ncbi:MAG: ELM1/GtrOC1 family putative glycosyltransferase [Planctomycetaceae bacterium]
MENRLLTIWCLLDGKAGHQNQVLGLAEAIRRQVSAELHPVVLTPSQRGFRSLLPSSSRGLPEAAPDLMIGAGHATHLPLWTFRRRFGGKSVVLMKPTLPLRCFDLCLVPDVHRLRHVPENTILTHGVLNRIQPSVTHDSGKGLILIGGPCSHYRWDSEKIADQCRAVIDRSPRTEWTIATSRRTPADFIEWCSAFETPHALIRPDDVGPDWLVQQLSVSGTVWVSEDSVSMTYEAVTAGGQVGVLELRRHRSNRVTDCIDVLVSEGYVTRWSLWQTTGKLDRRSHTFCEADRCARKILQDISPQAVTKTDDRPLTRRVA